MASKLAYTPVNEIPKIFNAVRTTFLSGKTRPLEFRKQQIKQLQLMMANHEEEWCDAMKQDLSRPSTESYLAEIYTMKHSTHETLKNLTHWAKPQKNPTSWFFVGTSPTVYKEPKGTVLVIAPWNYPISLALEPVLGAIAAGNTVVLKPSEQAAAVANLITKLFAQYLDPSCYAIVNGGIPETTKVLEQPFDHFFYTGSPQIGKLIGAAAAKHNAPATLELGGKSPFIVFDDANVAVAARRLLWGKVFNGGQTCVAPDYVICESVATKDKLIAGMKATVAEFYKDGQLNSADYSSIIHAGAFKRLKSLLDQSKGKIVIGGEMDESRRRMTTTVVEVELDDKLMEDEIFGPLLPVVTVNSKEEIVETVNKVCNTPLAMYCFTSSNANKDYVFERTRSGSFTLNDTLMHFIAPGLPFGGVGQAGYGNYHGEASFKCFSYERAGLSVPTSIEPVISLRYPPYSHAKRNLLGIFMDATVGNKPFKIFSGSAPAAAAAAASAESAKLNGHA